MHREYFYKDNRDYLFHQQVEIVEFEVKKVQRQLDLALQNDTLTLTEWELEEAFGKMDLNTNIPTASQLHGPMKQMTKRIVLIFRYNGKI